MTTSRILAAALVSCAASLAHAAPPTGTIYFPTGEVQQASGPELSRAEVKAEVLAARKNGDLFNTDNISQYTVSGVSVRARSDVKAEARGVEKTPGYTPFTY